MPAYRTRSRTERLRKKRRTRRNLLFFSSLAVLFFLLLFSLIAFGKNNASNNATTEDTSLQDEPNNVYIQDDEDAVNEMNRTNEAIDSDERANDIKENEHILKDVEVTEVDSIDDNVIVAYTGNWPPIGTEQTEPHRTNYEDGSLDRIEIKRAVSLVTDIPESEMIEHWIGNDGEQKVTATVSHRQSDQFYRVYLTWINKKGWQPTKVERLKEFKQ